MNKVDGTPYESPTRPRKPKGIPAWMAGLPNSTLLTHREVAEILDLCPDSIYIMAKDGHIPKPEGTFAKTKGGFGRRGGNYEREHVRWTLGSIKREVARRLGE